MFRHHLLGRLTTAFILFVGSSVPAAAQCDYASVFEGSLTYSGTCSGSNPNQSIITTKQFTTTTTIYCQNNNYFNRSLPQGDPQSISASGVCGNAPPNDPPECAGEVLSAQPYTATTFKVTTRTGAFNASTNNCETAGSIDQTVYAESQGCTGEICCSGDAESVCNHSAGEYYAYNCRCYFSPIIISLDGMGVRLTSAERGVRFDLLPDGWREQIAWTHVDSTDALLALDRNNNGQIDDGKELFGSVTPQPRTPQRNGFNALSMFDTNRDGIIDSADPVYAALKLWTDRNHNGASEPNELELISVAGILSISLDAHKTSRRDTHGNIYRYFASIKQRIGSEVVTRLAYDIFLIGGR